MLKEPILDFINNFFFNIATNDKCPEYLNKKIIHIKSWIDNANFLGDVISYLEFLSKSNDTVINLANQYLKKELEIGFNDLLTTLKEKFPNESIQKTTPSYFLKNQTYSSFDICFSMSVFNVQRSIVYSTLYPNLVILKAIMGSTTHDNGWIKEGHSFKYQLFFQVRNEQITQPLNHKFNTQLMPNSQNKILLFIKEADRSYKYCGEFFSEGLYDSSKDSKCVHLVKV